MSALRVGPAARQPAAAGVVFVSAGPGAVDLVTLRGQRHLAQAEVVLCDALVDREFRALAPAARWIDVGKRGYGPATRQARIHELMLQHARAGRRVVRLKGGDASLLGRLEEELQALHAAGITCEVVPGVTAALAAAADLQRPLTRRGAGRSVCLATAVVRETEGAARLSVRRGADSQVFYMAGRHLAALSRRLMADGWPADTPACVVSRAGCPDVVASEHRLHELSAAVLLHAGRPTVVTVGCAAAPLPAPDDVAPRHAAAGEPVGA